MCLPQSDNSRSVYCRGRTAQNWSPSRGLQCLRSSPNTPLLAAAFSAVVTPVCDGGDEPQHGDEEEYCPDWVEVKHTGTASFWRGSWPLRLLRPTLTSRRVP